MSSGELMVDKAPLGAKTVTFAHIFIREYARSVGGESSVPYVGDGLCPLGISDAVLLFSASGAYLGAEDVFSGGSVPLQLPQVRVPGKGSKRSRGGSEVDSGPCSGGGGGEGSSSSSGGGGAAAASSSLEVGGSAGAAGSMESGGSAGVWGAGDVVHWQWKRGEYYGGRVEDREATKDASRAAAAEAAAVAAASSASEDERGRGGSGRGRKRRAPPSAPPPPAPLPSPHGFPTPIFGRARAALLQKSHVLLPPGTDLASRIAVVSAEMETIMAGREESRQGCNCGPLPPELLESCSPSQLKSLCLERGLPIQGSKKALITRISDQSLAFQGCCHAGLQRLEAEGAAEEEEEERARQKKGAAGSQSGAGGGEECSGRGAAAGEEDSESSASVDISLAWASVLDDFSTSARLEQVNKKALEHHEQLLLKEMEAAQQPAASSAAAPPASQCPCFLSGEGCIPELCDCEEYLCDNTKGNGRSREEDCGSSRGGGGSGGCSASSSTASSGSAFSRGQRDSFTLRQLRRLIVALGKVYAGTKVHFEEQEIQKWCAHLAEYLKKSLADANDSEWDTLEDLENNLLSTEKVAASIRQAMAPQEDGAAGEQEETFEEGVKRLLLSSMAEE